MHLSARLVRGPPDSVLSLLTSGPPEPSCKQAKSLVGYVGRPPVTGRDSHRHGVHLKQRPCRAHHVLFVLHFSTGKSYSPNSAPLRTATDVNCLDKVCGFLTSYQKPSEKASVEAWIGDPQGLRVAQPGRRAPAGACGWMGRKARVSRTFSSHGVDVGSAEQRKRLFRGSPRRSP